MASALVTAFESDRPDLVLYESTNLGVLAAAEVGIPAVCLICGVGVVKSDELERRVAVWAEAQSR